MRRIVLVLVAAALMASLLVATSVPAFAKPDEAPNKESEEYTGYDFGVLVSSYGGEDRPTEQVSLPYQKVDIKYPCEGNNGKHNGQCP